uniref:Metalloendopeptidase n=1 Tax=Parastrongyloides trichosuri TaxID=131310 RepID=A0A0N5A0B1_PARTI
MDIFDETRQSALVTNKIKWAMKSKVHKIYPWNGPIKYFIPNSFKHSFAGIENAIYEIQNHTCIRFERQMNVITNGPGINFEKGLYCQNKKIGEKQFNTSQKIILTNNCATKKVIVQGFLHEALGQLSPVLRHDRDLYVKMNLDNMVPQFRDIFKQKFLPILNYTGTYDYESITHYSPMYFSINKIRKTIIPIGRYKKYLENMISRIDEASFNDYKLLNKYYCQNSCKQNLEKKCKNSGYQDPTNCKICVCPRGLTAPDCSVINYNFNVKCGHLKIYPSNHLKHFVKSDVSYCLYHLSVPFGKHIFIRFPGFKGIFRKKECSLKNSIEVKYKGLGEPGICLCYNENFGDPEIVSEGNVMLVIYNFAYYETYVHFEYMMLEKNRL